MILSAWFVSLVGIRVLLGFELSNIWGTAGAVAITFAIFYLALRYTPFSRYSKSVDAVLRDWYSKRYVFYGLIVSMAVLSTLIILTEVGYAYHPDKIISIWDAKETDNLSSTHSKLATSVDELLGQGYSRFDALAITIASVDKSLNGHYLQSVSFILGEDVEILVFLLMIKRIGNRPIFPNGKHDDNEQKIV